MDRKEVTNRSRLAAHVWGTRKSMDKAHTRGMLFGLTLGMECTFNTSRQVDRIISNRLGRKEGR